MADDVFEAAETPADNYLDKYVGEGKKFKNVEDLAKAYEHANTHIPKLTEDLQTTREFIANKLEELAQRNQAQPAPVQNEEKGNENTNVSATPPNDSGEDLDTRIRKILDETDQVKQFQGNAKLAEDVLIERLGSKEAAIEAVQKKANELGVEPGYLRDTAYRSPRAFFNLMGIDPDNRPTSQNTPAPSSDVNPRNLGHGQPKAGTYAYYEQIRKSDPKLYWAPRTQSQLMKDAQENPDFFKR